METWWLAASQGRGRFHVFVVFGKRHAQEYWGFGIVLAQVVALGVSFAFC